MAKAFSFKLSPEGWAEFKQTLEAIGPAGKKAIDQITAASPQLETAFQRAAKEVAAARKEIEGLGASAQGERGFGGVARGAELIESRVKGARRTLSDMQGTLQLIGPVAGEAAASMGRMVGVVSNVADSFGVLSALVRANPIGVLATVAGVAATAYFALRERTNEETEAIKQQADAIKALEADNARWLRSTEGLTDAQRRLTSEIVRARVEASKAELQALRPEPRNAIAAFDRTITDALKRTLAGAGVSSDLTRSEDLKKKIAEDEALLQRTISADEVRLQAAREADARAASDQAKAARELLAALDPLVKINAEYQAQLVKITELRLADALSAEDAARAYRQAAEQRDAADLKLRLDRAGARGTAEWENYSRDELETYRRSDATYQKIREQEGALRKLIEQAEREAELAGLTREEREAQLAVMRAQATAGRALTDEERARLEIATRQREAAEQAQRAAEKFARDLERTIVRSTDRAVDLAADTLYDAFTGRISSVGEFLKTTLLRATAQAAAEMVIRPLVQPLIASAVGAAPSLFGLSVPAGASAPAAGATVPVIGGAGGGTSGVLSTASNLSSAVSLYRGITGGFNTYTSAAGNFVRNVFGSGIPARGGLTGLFTSSGITPAQASFAGFAETAPIYGGVGVGAGAANAGLGAGQAAFAGFAETSAAYAGATGAASAGAGGAAGAGAGGLSAGASAGIFAALIILGRMIQDKNQDNFIGKGLLGLMGPGIDQIKANPRLAIAPAIGLPFLNAFGVFGADQQFPFAKARATTTNRYGAVTPYAVEELDGGDTTAMNNIVKAVGDLLKGVRGITGATFNPSEKFDVVTGRWAGDFSIFNAGRQFSGTPEQATLGMLRFWAQPGINAIQGLRPASRTVLQNVSSFEGLLEGLGFAEQFQDWADNATEYEKALRALNRTMDEAVRLAEQYGLDLGVVERERSRQRDALGAQAAGQALAPYAPLEQFVNALSFGQGSILAPRDQLANLRGQYGAALARARGGDQAALSDVANLAASIYALDRSYYGISATTVGDAAGLLADARGLLGNAREADPVVRAIYQSGAEGAAKVSEALGTVVNRLDQLLEQFTRAAGTPTRLLT